FGTEANNLGGPLDPDIDNVYVYDRVKKRVRLVSRRSGRSGAGGNDHSRDAFMSGNGRFVGFESIATNLGGPIQTDPLDLDANVYVYDLERKRVQLVSRQSRRAGGKGANDDSDDPVLSHSGRYVAFETNATNLGGPLNPANTSDNAYVYDRKLKRVELVGRASGRKGAACDDDCEDPYVSANGRFVAFEGEATNFGGPIAPGTDNVWVRDRRR
ncbi:MAG TPA: hypothetical protein VK919_09045, partial [Solirubrobacterales bacterium]|nr:hypothetical protein [Solirubrobacterales bacterium]